MSASEVGLPDYGCLVSMKRYKETTIVLNGRVNQQGQAVRIKAIAVRLIIFLILGIIHQNSI
jgi:hypothetical protein